MGKGGAKNIGDMIQELAKNGDEVYSIVCTVDKITDKIFADVTPVNGDATILGVKLVAGTSGTPLLITPVIDSVVVVTFLSKDTAYIALYSEIEEIQLRGDQFGGLIKIEDLVGKINDIENKLNSLIAKYNTHIHITTATVLIGAPGIIAPPVAVDTPIAPITLKTDLENPTVKHG